MNEDEELFQPYAKLFLSEDYGQILVTYNLDDEEGERSIDLRFQLPGGKTEVISQTYTKVEPDYILVQSLFEQMDEDIAIEAINDFIEGFGN